MYKPKIIELRISREEIVKHCTVQWEAQNYIRNRLSEEGFDLDKAIVHRECFESMHQIYSQEIR